MEEICGIYSFVKKLRIDKKMMGKTKYSVKNHHNCKKITYKILGKMDKNLRVKSWHSQNIILLFKLKK